jgi:predicted deacetylase
MNSRYLLRFDDLCPTMNWEMWSRIEQVLLEYRISPLLAVVPDNQDEKLLAGPARSGFWKQVREWQARDWAIGLHGYQHLYVTGDRGMVGIQARSEFAGLSSNTQEEKLHRGLEIFRAEKIEPQLWIAPAHSFDSNTVAALSKLGLTVISDGLALAPHVDANGMFWIPQQLWRFRRRPFGVWTVCFHHNHWSERQFDEFRRDIQHFAPAITDLATVKKEYCRRQHSISDSFYALAHSTVLSLRASWAQSA